ncbi:high-affinity glucose transporter ght5-like, partial [Mizuhopecten yessoensis]|uniref:high-affinity glucose transporter ght5-like n=1 Tax=Mizuhopecten yessoensis TaxID=6573 RepID=UPI000B45B4AC
MNSFQFLVAVTASLGGLLFGYEVGVMNVVLVMDAFNIFFHFSTWNGDVLDANGNAVPKNSPDRTYRAIKDDPSRALNQGIVTSTFVLGALCGALMATYLGEKYGRRNTIMIGSCIFTIGAILQGSSISSLIFISVGRFVTGTAIGCNGVLCPTYISEVAPAKIRGTLSSCYQLMTTFGIIVASCVNAIIWYYTIFIQVIPGVAFALLLSLLPKSPRWLCSKDRDEEATEVLAKLNAAATSDAIVQDELKAIQEDVAATRAAGSSSFSELFSPVIRRLLMDAWGTKTFLLFAAACLLAWLYSQFYCIESKGLTLEEMDAKMA